MSLRVPCLLALVWSVFLSSHLSAATAYRPPNLKKEIFDTKELKLDKFDRAGAVSSLVSVARDFDAEEDVDFELRAHALAIASRLDKDNAKVKSTLDQLKENGETIDEPAEKSRVTRRLSSAVRALVRKKDNDANQDCAAYIVDIAIRLDPDGGSVSKLENQRDELKKAGHKADWKGMLGSPIHRARNPWDQEEEVFEKKEVIMPGGEGKRFAQPQSHINGLVVRQLGNGNLSGSASTVNATALTEEGQDDLLFTFNQDVGPMMGGCLEEVIKFLRIRYDGQPDKIPDGYRIELGFQDKYVPKDGPSAATAFTLLLDSLFSGEKLDDDFACTGDMTADGMVQKIGGAAAKIRGATKRGCKIVGIPVGNGKEIGDLLLLDGIDQLLNIQIFTLKTFDQAHAVSRAEKSEEVAKTLELFKQVAAVVREKGGEMLANPSVQERLETVIERMPNHLSAQLLLQKGKGTNSKVLTIGGTLNQMEIVTSGTMRTVGRAVYTPSRRGDDDDDEPEDIEFDTETINDTKEAIVELEKLETAIDPRLKKYHGKVLNLCNSVVDGPEDDEKNKKYAARLKEEMDAIQSTYRKLIQDPEILEDMGG